MNNTQVVKNYTIGVREKDDLRFTRTSVDCLWLYNKHIIIMKTADVEVCR